MAYTGTLTLTDFLLARIAEDEAIARASREHEHLHYRDSPHLKWQRDVSSYGQIIATSGRVLAECEAKRRIVDLHGGFVPWPTSPRTVCETCADNVEADYDGAPMIEWPCPTLRALAAVYADHPDYRDEWRA